MNVLTKIPAKYRQLIYGIGSLALTVYGIWEASNHEWRTFVISLVTAIVGIMAAGNVDTTGNSVTVATNPTTGATIAHVVTPDTEAHFQL